MKRSERKKRSFKRGSGIAVIGEGPTEQYYLMSIQGLLPVNVYPKVVKDGMEYLSARVEECIEEGYDKIFCLIDMDNKSGKKEKEAYNTFLSRYADKKFHNRQTGEYTEVAIIENHPCLEIWFYYHFRMTTGLYSSYENINPLKSELKKYLPEYEKRIEFFRKCGGLHQYMNSKGGDIKKALSNSRASLARHADGGEGAFSEMCRMLDDMLKTPSRT